jgi:hypothetical protein
MKRVARIELAPKAWEAFNYVDLPALSAINFFSYPNFTPAPDPACIFRVHQPV